MEYRIFGSARSPGDDFTPELQAFCALEDAQREALAAWFESTSDFDTYATELPAGIVASALLPDQFRKTAAPIRFLLNAWQQHSLEIIDIERDLLLCGLNSEQIGLVISFLERLAPIKERVWIDGLEGTAQIVGLPTIDDVNIVWDARAVFGGPSYYHFRSDAAETTYKRCVGLTCVAIVEFMISDASGLKERCAMQMNETTFLNLLRAMNRADEHLKSLNALVGPMTVAQRASKA